MAADSDPIDHEALHVAVIGAGSAGERVADLLAGCRHRVTLIEDRLVGGSPVTPAAVPAWSP